MYMYIYIYIYIYTRIILFQYNIKSSLSSVYHRSCLSVDLLYSHGDGD